MLITKATSPVDTGIVTGGVISQSMTMTGNFLLAIAFFTNSAGYNTPTWGGVSMTNAVYAPNPGSGYGALGVWYLQNFTTGTQTFAATPSIATDGRWIVGSFNGVGGVANIGTPIGWAGSGPSSYTTYTTRTIGDYAFSIARGNGGYTFNNDLYGTAEVYKYADHHSALGSHLIGWKSVAFTGADASPYPIVHALKITGYDRVLTTVTFTLHPVVGSSMSIGSTFF